MKMLIRVFKVLIVIFLIRFMQSCCSILGGCSCDETPIPFNLTKISISNLNNSGAGIGINEGNSMYSSAVAFEVMVSDTNQFYPYYSACKTNSITTGFSTAMAFSYDCDPYFEAQEKIDSLRIITLYDINQAIVAGEEISDLFFAQSDYFPNTGLYANLYDVIDHLNTSVNNFPNLKLQVFLSLPVENNNARFAFNFYLNSGVVICDTTNLINILQN